MEDTNPQQNTPPSSPISEKKILIVEDDGFIGSLILRETLKNHPNATLVTSGEEAAEILKKDLPDFVILDIFLPGINGLDLLESLRKEERTKHLKVLVVSNTDQKEDRERARRLNSTFLLKAVVTPSEIIKQMEDEMK